MNTNTNITVNTETVEIILREQDQLTRWTPVEGDETYKLLEHLKFADNDRETLKREAVAVLAQCVPPTLSSGTETGLAIGYIQSVSSQYFGERRVCLRGEACRRRPTRERPCRLVGIGVGSQVEGI